MYWVKGPECYSIRFEKESSMKLQLVTMMAACLVVAQGATAGDAEQGEAWNRHKGFWAEADVGTGWGYIPDEAGFQGFAWVGALGYRFTVTHAIEGGVGQWHMSREDDDDAYVNFGYLAWRGTVPIADRFAFFGKAGIALLNNPDHHDDGWAGGPFLGLGLSYAVTPQIDLDVQVQGVTAVFVGGGVVTAGAAYHF
jgi:hypothetical protein